MRRITVGVWELPKIGNEPHLFRRAVRAAGAMQRAADLGRDHGGVMRIGRKIIIPAILALGAAGSILASSAATATVAQAPAAHHVVAASSHIYYHG